MQLEQLIERLQSIRRQALSQGRENINVLFRDPANGFLFDEISPFLTEVFDDEAEAFSAFDMQVGDFYAEI